MTARIRIRPAALLAVAVASVSTLSTVAAGAQVPELREQVVVREVPVLADLPAGWRDQDLSRLAAELVVVEDGTPRELVAATPVAPPAGAGFSRLTVAVDRLHCRDTEVAAAVPAIAALAPRWVELGPVDVVRLGPGARRGAEPTRDARQAGEWIADLAGTRCALEPAAAAPDLSSLSCPAVPCLLVWIGGPWRGGDAAGASLEAAAEAAQQLALDGWSVIAVGPAAEAVERPAGSPGTQLPGSDETSWTIDLRDPKRGAAGAEPADDRAVDVELAPLRRLVAATAGELALGGAEVAAALDAMATRTLLYYRTDRSVDGTAAPLVVREAGEHGRRFAAPQWAVRSGRR